jgi:hypothetical protein
MRRIGRAALWVALMLLVGEGAVRAVALVLSRDAGVVTSGGGDVVYCIGDSFTYGQGVKREEAWPQVLGRLLADVTPGRPPQMRTLAEPGRSSSVAVLDVRSALQAGDARLVLVLTGWNANDGDFAAYASSHARAVPWTSAADLWLSHSRLYRVVKQALTARSRAIVFDDVRIVPQTTSMSLYDFHAYQEIGLENLRQIARMCRAARVPCALLTYPHQLLPPSASARTEYYHSLFGRTPLTESDYLLHDRRPGEIAIDAVIRHVAETEGIVLVDTQPAFDAAQGANLFLADYHHPTPAGHELIAHAVLDAVRGGFDAVAK